ncbi:hypothetical protein CTI12_AA165640 [Artemisia annua]|uniref:Retrotransposon gag domain-containing protein n=1 Tax=Artemisia annua TaxID=35608 RepID=A0A2U1PD53_ARTAN|nr:hypothetical protein CTI12_AA165640 [Artemisia annua]
MGEGVGGSWSLVEVASVVLLAGAVGSRVAIVPMVAMVAEEGWSNEVLNTPIEVSKGDASLEITEKLVTNVEKIGETKITNLHDISESKLERPRKNLKKVKPLNHYQRSLSRTDVSKTVSQDADNIKEEVCEKIETEIVKEYEIEPRAEVVVEEIEDNSFNLRKHITCDPFHDANDSLVVMWIYSTISPKLVGMIIDNNGTAHSVWKRLMEIFHDNKDTRVIQLDNEIRNMAIGNLSVNDYFQEIKSMDFIANFWRM